MLFGYARVSTHDQNLDLQHDALEAAGCERVIVDTVSGAAAPARPGLAKLKDVLRAGDTPVVWRLDRLGRSLKDLIAWVGYLEERQVGLRSLHEGIDTTMPTFHVFDALAEFERALIRERPRTGLAAARARGRKGGRRPVLNADRRALAMRLYNECQTPIARLWRMMGISKPTLYSHVRAANGVTDGLAANSDARTAPDTDAGHRVGANEAPRRTYSDRASAIYKGVSDVV
jgi:DNA invertase Pin-like site-specific DNA recombinase